MDLSAVFAVIALAFALGSIYFGVRIANELRSRGGSAKPALVRWMLFRYMNEYKRVTIEETGEAGPLYRRCSMMLVLTIVFAVIAIMAKAL